MVWNWSRTELQARPHMVARCFLMVALIAVAGCGKADDMGQWKGPTEAKAAAPSPCPKCECPAASGADCTRQDGEVANLKKDVSDLTAKLADANTKLAAAETAKKPATDDTSANLAAEAKAKECESLKQKLADAEAKVRDLSVTPEAMHADLLALVDKATTVADTDAVAAEIIKFTQRFPGSEQAKALKGTAKALLAQRAAFAKEEAKEKAAEATKSIKEKMGEVEDGDTLAAAAARSVADYLDESSTKFDAISLLPRANYAEAMKDPDSERGKSLVVSGQVIQISKEGDYFAGIICQGFGCAKVTYFVTPGTTKGIVQGRSATFAGVVVQRYAYSNAGGGTTHSILVVGYFKGQE